MGADAPDDLRIPSSNNKQSAAHSGSYRPDASCASGALVTGLKVPSISTRVEDTARDPVDQMPTAVRCEDPTCKKAE